MTDKWENAIALALIVFVISGIVVFLPSWLRKLRTFIESKGGKNV